METFCHGSLTGSGKGPRRNLCYSLSWVSGNLRGVHCTIQGFTFLHLFKRSLCVCTTMVAEHRVLWSLAAVGNALPSDTIGPPQCGKRYLSILHESTVRAGYIEAYINFFGRVEPDGAVMGVACRQMAWRCSFSRAALKTTLDQT